MSTATELLAESLDNLRDVVERKEQEIFEADADAIRAEVEAVDVGGFAADEDEAMVLRYLRMRTRTLAEITHLKDQTEAMLRRLENSVKGLDYVYRAKAEEFARRKIHGKAKSYKTPFGTVGFRKGQAKVTVVDAASVLAYAQATPGMEKCWRQLPQPAPEVCKGELNRYVKETGDVPAGCTVEPARDEFYVS